MLTNSASSKPQTPIPSTVSARWSRVALAVEKALGFLHNPGGPYHDVTAPPLQLIDVRQIASNVIILQASWKSPVMNPDGKLDLAKQNNMLVSYTLLQESGDWKATTDGPAQCREDGSALLERRAETLALLMEARC